MIKSESTKIPCQMAHTTEQST